MSFSTQIAGFGKNTADAVQGVRRSATLALFNSVIMDTPVDTGRLRGNWQITEGQPASGTVATPDEGPNPASGPSGAAPQNTQNVKDAVDRIVLPSTGDNEIFLTNNLPYAWRVEFEGHSHTKAPQGMVRRNIQRFGQIVRKALAKKKP